MINLIHHRVRELDWSLEAFTTYALFEEIKIPKAKKGYGLWKMKGFKLLILPISLECPCAQKVETSCLRWILLSCLVLNICRYKNSLVSISIAKKNFSSDPFDNFQLQNKTVLHRRISFQKKYTWKDCTFLFVPPSSWLYQLLFSVLLCNKTHFASHSS